MSSHSHNISRRKLTKISAYNAKRTFLSVTMFSVEIEKMKLNFSETIKSNKGISHETTF